MGLMTILKKELSRVFLDKKMIFSMFILPPLMMIIIFNLIGSTMGGVMDKTISHTSIIYAENMDLETRGELEASAKKIEIIDLEASKLEENKEALREGNIDAIIVLPEGFREDIENYDGSNIPNIQIFYNPSEENSNAAYGKLMNAFDGEIKNRLIMERLEDPNILQVFTINAAGDEEAQIYKEEKLSGMFLATMLPYFIIIMLFSSIMGLAIDTFTGEKERGTMASLLLAPVNRMDIVLGKLLGLTIVSMLSAAVYTVSFGVAIPKLMGDMEGPTMTFSGLQFLQIGLIMLSMAFLLVALISVVATYAKSTKEGATYVSPLYIIVIIAGVLTMAGTSGASLPQFLIPIYGPSLAISNIIIGELTSSQLILSVGSNLLLGFIFSYIVAKMFNSEKIMFNS